MKSSNSHIRNVHIISVVSFISPSGMFVAFPRNSKYYPYALHKVKEPKLIIHDDDFRSVAPMDYSEIHPRKVDGDISSDWHEFIINVPLNIETGDVCL